ncbi:uncharacterized protein [Rutidosis leptorrhynchoides]|uniref:uncharacterized protein n=1 Tax=Rutidosis leptorrhynchoides TaxID=125765 RepID=UPI003A9A5C6B
MLGLLNDYDCELQYHPGKANVIADALSRKERERSLRVKALNIIVRTNLTSQISEAQLEAVKQENVDVEFIKGLDKKFDIKEDGTRYFANRIWVKAEHQKLSGLLTQPEIPQWKWKCIAMD